MIRCGGSNILGTESVMLNRRFKAAVTCTYLGQPSTLLFGTYAQARKVARGRGEFGIWRVKR